MPDENEFSQLFLMDGDEKICKVGISGGKTILIFQRRRRRGDERVERFITLDLEDYLSRVLKLRDQLLSCRYS